MKSFSHVLFAALWTVAHLTLLPMDFSRQEFWSGLLLSTPGDLPNPGIKPASSVFSETLGKTLGSNTRNKASLGYRISAELFKILNNDAVEVLSSICQQIWETQQWPQD